MDRRVETVDSGSQRRDQAIGEGVFDPRPTRRATTRSRVRETGRDLRTTNDRAGGGLGLGQPPSSPRKTGPSPASIRLGGLGHHLHVPERRKLPLDSAPGCDDPAEHPTEPRRRRPTRRALRGNDDQGFLENGTTLEVRVRGRRFDDDGT